MPEYVTIASSPGEIIGIANRLRNRGDDLVGTVTEIREGITERESRGETFPSDQFTDAFLQIYHQDVPGADGNVVAANVAVQESATYCGNKLREIGDTVNIAMTNYEATDDDSGDSIARTV